ncbi:porin family protein [Flavobacterium selenitireducens]|uniref:porin family protein n=1 Tax=Flavobacterium selenitireducens TaxID=2722704 RepID=UPI00168BE953|nr:porin family protein [Flavobacterium selenitireducens]MBD3581931.1 PorT family protein [Flavobacterium selenitireducens]
MRKILLLACVAFTSHANSQNWSYGVILGLNMYNDQSSNSGQNEVFFDSGNEEFAALNLGGYVEYQFSENMGIKAEATFNEKTFEKGFSNLSLNERYTLNYVDVNPLFKYDFGSKYRQGFYMILGPKFGFLTNSKVNAPENDEAATDDFKPIYVNLDFGIGWRVLKVVDVQGKVDYGLTPFYKDQYNGCKIFGGYFSVNVDLDRILFNK